MRGHFLNDEAASFRGEACRAGSDFTFDFKEEQKMTLNRLLAVAILTSHFVCAADFAVGNPRGDGTRDASAAIAADAELVGIWEMTVQGSATYRYKYAISIGTWVTNGDVDKSFFGYQFSPTTGAYARHGHGSYRYRERGWTYDLAGVCNGSFESTGTFVVDSSGDRFSGPGSFRMFDLTGIVTYTEDFTVVAIRVGI